MITTTLLANAMQEYKGPARFFRLMAAGAPVTVRFYLRGAQIAESEGVSGGYAEKFADGFDKVTLLSVVEQQIQFVARLSSEVAYDMPPNGSVSGPFTRAAIAAQDAVTAGVLFAANAARRVLFVQNNSGTNYLRLRVEGVAAVAAGVRIAPGDYWEPPAGYAPTGAVSVIAEAGTVAIEGLEG